MYEIERRFTLNTSLANVITRLGEEMHMSYHDIEQVYMPDSGGWTIRARQAVAMGSPTSTYLMTLKRRINDRRSLEIERPITLGEYQAMKELCRHEPIIKRRHWSVEMPFTIDEFLNTSLRDRRVHKEDDNLVIAEIELKSEDESFFRPWWLGHEMHSSWSNRMLAQALTKEQ